ncbi:MlaE family lipid ABC transporter permease subunit [Novosphingobium sp.]|uniref:ABC transporter permease n=1 Tax=Novosphingobium sp. TaxID=1874826 RepID=UPI0035AED233
MRDLADFTVQADDDGALTVAFIGPLVVASVGQLDPRLRALEGPVRWIDLSEVDEIDTTGAWIVWRLARDNAAQITGASEEAERLIDALRLMQGEAAIVPVEAPLLQRVPAFVGDYVARLGTGTLQILDFLGAMLIAAWKISFGPSRLRVNAVVRQVELVGVTALPIVGLMSFLVGIVIAQQGAVQLEDLGFGEMTINLVGRISLRELGILMTAIMVAGRSGSSFAAQIGTMKLTEEVDAMRTIGVSPMEALVIPRVLAAILVMPLLGFYSALLSIIGGAAISTLTLDIPFLTFLTRIQEVVPTYDLWVGLIKGPVFGLIIALTGCYQGMQVKGNSEEVGHRTTVAVVQAIFAVIVLDAFFAVFFTEVGWG